MRRYWVGDIPRPWFNGAGAASRTGAGFQNKESVRCQRLPSRSSNPRSRVVSPPEGLASRRPESVRPPLTGPASLKPSDVTDVRRARRPNWRVRSLSGQSLPIFSATKRQLQSCSWGPMLWEMPCARRRCAGVKGHGSALVGHTRKCEDAWTHHVLYELRPPTFGPSRS